MAGDFPVPLHCFHWRLEVADWSAPVRTPKCGGGLPSAHLKITRQLLDHAIAGLLL